MLLAHSIPLRSAKYARALRALLLIGVLAPIAVGCGNPTTQVTVAPKIVPSKGKAMPQKVAERSRELQFVPQSGSLEASLKEQFASVQCETEAEVEGIVAHAAACKRAIMFIHLGWAPMHVHHDRYISFMLQYNKTHPNKPIHFHYVDCTPITNGYRPLRALEGWKGLEEKRGGGSLIHGNGELVWVQDGRVVHVETLLYLTGDSTMQLLEITEKVMPSIQQTEL
jgi:hypothetical protein